MVRTTRAVLVAVLITLISAVLLAQSQERDNATGLSTDISTRKVGAALPLTCNVGDRFFLTGVPVGQNLYGCTALNTWTLLSVAGGVGGAALLVTDYAVPVVSTIDGSLMEWKIKCTGSPVTCTMYDDTAVTGSMTLAVREGVDQGVRNMISLLNSAGNVRGFLNIVGDAFRIGNPAIDYLDFYISGIRRVRIHYDGHLVLGSDALLKVSSTSGPDGTPDVGQYRNSKGVWEDNSGTIGQWGTRKLGYVELQSLATPAVPVITQGGTGGATTYGYKVAACLADATRLTAASTEGTTATGNATLNVTNYNIVTGTAVTGASGYSFYRTTGGATQRKIATCQATMVLNDTGLVASGAAPASGYTGTVKTLRYDTATNCASGASPAACGAASAGAVALPAGGTTLTVNTTAVTALSRVLITENTTVGAELSVTCNATIVRTYAVTTITAGTSFVITASAAPVGNPACLGFFFTN